MDFKKFYSGGENDIRMSATHALFVGHKPASVNCEEGLCENILSDKTPETIASFGLFGGSNDLNKFYPELTAEDWTPKEADFIQPVFRALSETIVYQFGRVPIDFSEPGILKASMAKLKGQTVNTNHDTEVENAVGSVASVRWQEATKVNGITVPGGINAVFKIDAKSNPRLARGILMDPPSVHSDSVTIRFKHEPSHSFSDPDEFWRKLGTLNDEGELIRLKVVDIISYKEVSLVGHGADPYAQVVNEDNEINNPKYATSVYNFKENNPIINKPHKNKDMEFTELLAQLGLQDSGIENWDGLVAHFTQEPEVAPEVALFNALREVDEDLTPDSLTALRENQLPEGAVLLGENETVLTEQEAVVLEKVTELGGLEAIESQVTLGQTYLKNIRDNAIRDYKLTAGDYASEEIIETIKDADLKTAKAFETSYHAQLEKMLPLTCQSCGSENVTRASHKKDNEDIGTGEDSYKESRDKAAKRSRRKASDIHQK